MWNPTRMGLLDGLVSTPAVVPRPLPGPVRAPSQDHWSGMVGLLVSVPVETLGPTHGIVGESELQWLGDANHVGPFRRPTLGVSGMQ